MFDFFKKNKDTGDLNVKILRDSLLQFIKNELQRLDGGEGTHIAMLQLYLAPAAQDRFSYETASYYGEQQKLKDAIQLIADNFALELPANWQLELLFVEELPAAAICNQELQTAIFFKRKLKQQLSTATSRNARLLVVWGDAEQPAFSFTAAPGRINIGREKNVQSPDGSFRINTIAFPLNLSEENKYISRQHAHIEYDAETESFRLYADEGGVPPGNKTKIRWAKDETVQKLNSTDIGYPLAEGDQVILADKVVLQFSFL